MIVLQKPPVGNRDLQTYLDKKQRKNPIKLAETVLLCHNLGEGRLRSNHMNANQQKFHPRTKRGEGRTDSCKIAGTEPMHWDSVK